MVAANRGISLARYSKLVCTGVAIFVSNMLRGVKRSARGMAVRIVIGLVLAAFFALGGALLAYGMVLHF